MLFSHGPQFIVVNLARINIFHFITHKVKHFVNAGGRMTMSEMPAML